MKKNVLKKRIITSTTLIFLVYLIFNSIYFMISSFLILGILSIIEFLNISNRIFKKKIYFLTTNLIYIFLITIFSISFYILYNYQQTKFLLFILLIGCIASDIGGYVFGKLLKGPKLTKVSPNKTISGALGSFILSCLAISVLIYFETNVLKFSFILIGIMTSLYCQLGDLFFSYLKRKAKLKDTGNILPGHGGVLDRLDGILFGIPLGFLTLILLF
tara:strand:- start:725 stop:1375 length:651 start_codon:yes stop_codon:yes gene_type:complete